MLIIEQSHWEIEAQNYKTSVGGINLLCGSLEWDNDNML